VIREAAEAGPKAVTRGANLKQTISAVVTQARKTVKETPEMLPQLKDAGVVDAGGKVYSMFFLGMKQFFSRETDKLKSKILHSNKRKGIYSNVNRFDLQFLIEGEKLPVK